MQMNKPPISKMRRRGWSWIAAPVALAAAGAMYGPLFGSGQTAHEVAPLQSAPQGANWFNTLPPTGSGGTASEGTHVGPTRTVAEIQQALLVKGSLRGVDLPPWGSVRGQPLKPNRTLRDRFDFYLLAMGEASLAELSKLLRAHAEQDLGPDLATGIYAIWERYLQLQAYTFVRVANPADIGSMQAALQEHQQVRQQLLGAAWAKAFYGEDEAQLAGDIDRIMSGGELNKPDPDQALFSPPQGMDPQALHEQRVARFGKDKADRLKELDDAEAEWMHRVEAVRGQVHTLKQSAHLSTLQRNQAISNLMDSAFPDAIEKMRASGLVGL